MPTHDAEGKELAKSALKKLAKQYDAQEKNYKKYLASQENGASGLLLSPEVRKPVFGVSDHV